MNSENRPESNHEGLSDNQLYMILCAFNYLQAKFQREILRIIPLIGTDSKMLLKTNPSTHPRRNIWPFRNVPVLTIALYSELNAM